VGIVWELFGNCLGIVWEFKEVKRGVWELFGIVWEFQGVKRERCSGEYRKYLSCREFYSIVKHPIYMA
jgi:hypothetical protein